MITSGRGVLDGQARSEQRASGIDDVESAEACRCDQGQRFRELFEYSHDGVFLLDVDDDGRFRIAGFNPSEERLVGVTSRIAEGWYVDEVFPDLASTLTANYRRCVEAAQPISYDEELLLPRGRRAFATTLIPVVDEGRVHRIIGVARDVTREKIALEELRASEERFRVLAENIREVFWMTDARKSEILYVSPGYEATWGRTCQSLREVPSSWLDAIDPADRPSAEEWASRQEEGPTETTYRIRRPDGAIRWIRDRSFPVRDGEGNLVSFVGLAEDLTPVIRTEERLAQSQKFEALGQLAGGVAHDFNNILSVILSYSHLVLMDLAPGALRSDLEEVCRAAGRATELTKQLLAFSHQQVLRPEVLDLGHTVARMKSVLSKLLGENVELAITTSPSACCVHADPGQIERVIMNLAVNARDAMSRQGKLRLETERVTVDSARGGDMNIEPGEYVMLTISDTGAGMTTETLKRIFEPFFTTKGIGRGTGLGLSIVSGIVEQTGGSIRVESVLGRGSVFRIFFPHVAGVAVAREPELASSDTPGGTETILFVADDLQVLSAACAILRRKGYRVLDASNGGEALLLAEQHEGAIDLLLTDVIMRRMTGAQLARRLTSVRPNMRVLYLSGQRELSPHDCPTAADLVVDKPFTPEALTRKVRAVLG